MTVKSLMLALCVLSLSGGGFARAQTSPSQDCTPTQSKPDDPNGLNTTGRGDTPLTDKLAQSGGVLCPPPAADSDIRVPPPSTGSNMPVVPPPGGPGGDQSVKPK